MDKKNPKPKPKQDIESMTAREWKRWFPKKRKKKAKR